MSAATQNKLYNSLVSIIIPFFNRENFLAEAVESVLAQTHQSWELILISTDKSPQIAADFVKQYPGKVSLYAHENGANRGASSSRNLSVKHASGDFITFLDSNDVFLPETLATEVKLFEQNAEAEAVCGTLQHWFSWTEESGKEERDFIVNLGIEAGKIYAPPDLLIHNLRAGGRKPGIGCVILRSGLARKFNLFEDDFKYMGED